MMNELMLESKSGWFICNGDYYAYDFIPKTDNLEATDGIKSIVKHFVVPQGVVGFMNCFGRNMTVLEEFSLPDSVKVIGTFLSLGWDNQCVFANTKLPTVIIPESVEFSGIFSFGNSQLDALCLPREYTEAPKEYVRAYKNCLVKRLYIHESGLNTVLGESGTAVDYNFSYGLRAVEIYAYTHRGKGCLPTEVRKLPYSKNL